MLSLLVGLQIRTIDLRSRMTGALRGEEGQGLTEYALILFLVSIAAVVALTTLGKDISKVLNEVTEHF